MIFQPDDIVAKICFPAFGLVIYWTLADLTPKASVTETELVHIFFWKAKTIAKKFDANAVLEISRVELLAGDKILEAIITSP